MAEGGEYQALLNVAAKRLCELVDEDERLNGVLVAMAKPTDDLSRDASLAFADVCGAVANRLHHRLRGQESVTPAGQYL